MCPLLQKTSIPRIRNKSTQNMNFLLQIPPHKSNMLQKRQKTIVRVAYLFSLLPRLIIRYQISGLRDKNKRPATALNNSVSSTPIKPSAKQVKINDGDETDLKKIYDLMAQMNIKLNKLHQIEIHLAQVDQDIKD